MIEEDIKILEHSQSQMRLGNLPEYNQEHYKAIEHLLQAYKEQEKVIDEIAKEIKKLIGVPDKDVLMHGNKEAKQKANIIVDYILFLEKEIGIKKCIICGKKFTAKTKNTICCSDKCKKERKKQSSKNHYQKHRKEINEKYLDYRKKYIKENYNKIKEYQEKYRKNNPDKIKKYREKNLDKIREYQKQYRLKLKLVGSKYETDMS